MNLLAQQPDIIGRFGEGLPRLGAGTCVGVVFKCLEDGVPCCAMPVARHLRPPVEQYLGGLLGVGNQDRRSRSRSRDRHRLVEPRTLFRHHALSTHNGHQCAAAVEVAGPKIKRDTFPAGIGLPA